jgi:hypothetical protein
VVVLSRLYEFGFVRFKLHFVLVFIWSFGSGQVVKWSVSFVGCCVIIPAFSYLSLHSV